MQKKIILLIFIFSVNILKSNSQTAPDTTLLNYCAVCSHHQHIDEIPYELSFKKEVPFIIVSGGTLLSGLIIAAVHKSQPVTVGELSTLNVNDIPSFDRKAVDNWSPSAGTASDIVLVGITVLPVIFLTDHHAKKDITSLVAMALEVFTFNWGVTNITKNLTERTRPYVYNTSLDTSIRTDAVSRESFISGHTSHTASATFLFAKVISDYHSNMKPGLKFGMWAFAVAVPAVEGYLRLTAGKHFPTDVIAGYAIGAASGWLIPHFHKKKKETDKIGLGFFPYKDGMMLNLNIRL